MLNKSQSIPKRTTAKYPHALREASSRWRETNKTLSKPPKVAQGEIYLARLSPALRTLYPVIVVQTNKLNQLHYPSTVVVPCWKGLSANTLLRESFPKGFTKKAEPYHAAIDCVRMINLRNLRKPLGTLEKKKLKSILKKLSELLKG